MGLGVEKKSGNSSGFLEGAGEMAALIRAFDWTATPLGSIGQWSPILKATISLILRSPVPLVTLWGELGIMIYNDAYSRFAGQRHPRLLGSEVRMGWPEVADWNDNVMKVGLAGGTLSYRDQVLTLWRQGVPEDVWLDLDYSPVTDESGKPVGVIAIVVEITDKVTAQQALRENEARLQRLNQTLESRVEERTAALLKAQQALQQAQKMDAIGKLTGGIAHDFNNLLMAVISSLELLRKRLPVDPVLLRLIDNAMEGAQRGSSLTRRMLAFARRQDLKSEPIDIPLLVEGMRELMQRALGPSVAVKTEFSTQLPKVETDSNQLESALLNLTVNARDAMQGEGEIVISACAVDVVTSENGLKPGVYVCMSVRDTGEGMDEETLKRATEPFFTTKGVGKGTGLGLSMVHGLAEQAGGTLVLRSRKGKGTTAEIWLPAASAVAAAAVTPLLAKVPLPKPQTQMHIMAIDDDPLVLMNTTMMLEDLGHTVMPVGSGAEALKLLHAGKIFDIVITDHAMPQMTGSQFVQEAVRERANLKVLLATGYAELPPGADTGLPRISKPFTQTELVEAIARLCEH